MKVPIKSIFIFPLIEGSEICSGTFSCEKRIWGHNRGRDYEEHVLLYSVHITHVSIAKQKLNTNDF